MPPGSGTDISNAPAGLLRLAIIPCCGNDNAARLHRGDVDGEVSEEHGAPAPPAPPQQVGAGRVALTATLGPTQKARRRSGGGARQQPTPGAREFSRLACQEFPSERRTPLKSRLRRRTKPFGLPATARDWSMRDASMRRSPCCNDRSGSIRPSPRRTTTLALPCCRSGGSNRRPGRSAPPFASTPASRPRTISAIFSTLLASRRRAIEEYQSAVALQPALVEAQMRLGDLYLARGLRARNRSPPSVRRRGRPRGR